jgi:hypothetical protein
MSIFQRRHYEAIATAMQWATQQADANVIEGVNLVIRNAAAMLIKDNPQFDRDRFLRACIPGANVKSRT